MSYLGIALFAEGPTDHRFFAPLLIRLVEDIYFSRGKGNLDIGDVILLTPMESERENNREDQIVAAAQREASGFHILVVHADGGGNPSRARAQQVSPGLDRALLELGEKDYAGVAVVPIREMEAWTLVDGDALRKAFRTNLSDNDLGVVSRPRDCEKIRDPKAVLDTAYRKTLPGSKRGINVSASGVLQLISEQIRLSLLDQVPAFRSFRDELEAGLLHLGFIS